MDYKSAGMPKSNSAFVDPDRLAWQKRIDELEAEVRALRAARDDAQDAMQQWRDNYWKATAEVARLAEVLRSFGGAMIAASGLIVGRG